MKINIYIFPNSPNDSKPINHSIVPTHIGHIEADKFDAEECWHLCNWSEYTDVKPKNLHADISFCTHGICFVDPVTNQRWLAKSFGWLVGNSTTISDYVLENRHNLLWS